METLRNSNFDRASHNIDTFRPTIGCFSSKNPDDAQWG